MIQFETETEKKLYELLMPLCSEDDFVYSTLDILDTDEKRRKMIDYVEKYDITDVGDLITMSDDIADGLEPEIEE